MRMRSPRIAPPLKGLVGSTAMMPIVLPCLRYSRAIWSTNVLLPAPGEPVGRSNPAFPLYGKSAFSSSVDSAVRSSTTEMARAKARRSPPRSRLAISEIGPLVLMDETLQIISGGASLGLTRIDQIVPPPPHPLKFSVFYGIGGILCIRLLE